MGRLSRTVICDGLGVMMPFTQIGPQESKIEAHVFLDLEEYCWRLASNMKG